MGGVDLSDALIGYYNILHKTKKWYRTLFYHFIDMGIVNAFIMHKDTAKERNETPKAQKDFRWELIQQLAAAGSPTTVLLPPPAPTAGMHLPTYIGTSAER